MAAALWLAAGSARAEDLPPLKLGAGTKRVDLTPFLTFSRDETGQKKVEDLRVPGRMGFQKIEGVWKNFGFTPDTVWGHFRMSSAEPGPTEWLVEYAASHVDEIRWYVYRGDVLMAKADGGILKPGRFALMNFRHPVLPVTIGPGETLDIYFRIRSETSIAVPMILWDPVAYGEKASRLEWRSGAYFGYLAAMVAIGLCFAIFNRDRIFLVYSLMNAFFWMLFFCTGGYVQWHGLPGSEFWTHQGVLLAMAGCLLSMLWLLRYLFTLPRAYPRFDRWFRIALWGLAALSLFAMVAPYRPVIMLELGMVMLICVVVALCSYHLFFRVYKIHQLYFIAWLGLWIGTFLLFLQPFGVTPMWATEEQNMRGIMGYGAFFFLLALAARSRQNRDEKEQIRAREMAAVEASKFKSLFLANMSHEIRAPLSSLVGLSQAMCAQSEKHALPPEFVKFLNQIRVGGQYLNMMLTNLLDVSSAEAGRNPVHWKVIKLGEWAEQVRSLLDPAALHAEVRLEWKVEIDPNREMETDPIRLTQILLNLMHNAIKFSPKGSAVEIALAEEEGRLRLMVSDQGPGIREEEMASIFQSFTQGATRSETGPHGAGLGLAVVRQNAKLLGGTVTVENRRCGGACFTVRVPLKR